MMRVAEGTAETAHQPIREVRRADRRERQELQREVAVADAVEGIARGAVEAQRLCRGLAIDRKRRARERARAQRALVEPRAGIPYTAAVAAEHLDIGHEVMAKGH